jgi:protein-S-isoprenylcysteine O-methyltransferase Ste14
MKLNRDGLRNIVGGFLYSLFHLGVLLLAAGKIGWINAWVSAGLNLAYQVVNTLVLLRLNPELVNKRGQSNLKSTKTYDKVFVALWFPLGILVSVVAGLDAVRYGWSRMPLALNVLGVIIYALACLLGTWAMAVNPHFETVLVIQREHPVCASGPYRIIRHPGYAAAILGAPSYPLILGSWWGLAALAPFILLFLVRTALEDRTLHQELPGYRDYAASTRYRLLPGVW